MTERHKRIINAVIRKAEERCPDSLALIGVYGSCATGDTHERSDLDLLILINDEGGRCLADAFILDDADVGYDLYCTTWEMLEEDAECRHPHLGRLMDARVVYVKDPHAPGRLESLRRRAANRLYAGTAREHAYEALDKAKLELAECCLADGLYLVRLHAAAAVRYLLDALMLYHGCYFRKGVKRTFEEVVLPEWESDRFVVKDRVMDVICGERIEDIREALAILVRDVRELMDPPKHKKPPTAEDLKGTYEEMYSNWRGKVYEAAEREDVFSSFMNLASVDAMLAEVGETVTLGSYNAMKEFRVYNLRHNATALDGVLERYLDEYREVGLRPRRFADVEAFLEEYVSG